MKSNAILTCLCLFFSFSIFAQNLENLKDKKPIEFSSGLSLTTNFYGINGADPRQQAFSYFLSGTPTLTLYGISRKKYAFNHPFFLSGKYI